MVERFELRPSILCLAGLVLVTVLTCCQGAVLDFPAESADYVDSSSLRMRSNAEGNLTVWLRDDEQLNMTFCLPAADTVTVTEVRFSCDGLAKEVAVLVDGGTVGTFKTVNNSKNGYGWNEFNTSVNAFDQMNLTAGQHTIQVVLFNYSDIWGIEIDSVKVRFGKNVTKDEVVCEPTETTEATTEPNGTTTTGTSETSGNGESTTAKEDESEKSEEESTDTDEGSNKGDEESDKSEE